MGAWAPEFWHPCKVYIKVQKQKPRQAYVVLHGASVVLDPRSYVLLLLRHPNGTVIQVPGRVARRRSRDAVEIYIPVDAALTLAVWMGVKVEGNTAIYGYAAKIESVHRPT
jgi:hypothetical protein